MIIVSQIMCNFAPENKRKLIHVQKFGCQKNRESACPRTESILEVLPKVPEALATCPLISDARPPPRIRSAGVSLENYSYLNTLNWPVQPYKGAGTSANRLSSGSRQDNPTTREGGNRLPLVL
jgi:hypothetical protein